MPAQSRPVVRLFAILSMFWGWVVDGSIWGHLGATLTVMSLGYVIGCTAGVTQFPSLGALATFGWYWLGA